MWNDNGLRFFHAILSSAQKGQMRSVGLKGQIAELQPWQHLLTSKHPETEIDT